MKPLTAWIESVEGSKGLWLMLSGPGDDVPLPTANDEMREFLDTPGAVKFPIMPEEVIVIRDACQSWLDKQNAEVDEVVDRVLEAHAD